MIIAWILISFIVAFIGRDRKIGYGGTVLLSLLLSPIIGAIFALASPRKTDEGNTKKCPFCAENVKVDAMICKHCGRSLESNSDFDIEQFRN